MKISNTSLIEDLIERTRENLNQAESFMEFSSEMLNWRQYENKWSILECIAHLNLYGDFYLPEINNRIENARQLDNPIFRSGWLGNYFAKSMLPREKLNKMKTFKSMNPLGSKLDKEVLKEFINQQKTMLRLLDKARTIDLTKTKTSISISNFIKLRLGDTFRVVIYHNQRHIVQANNVLVHHKEMSGGLKMEV
ncbi:DinB family protein [Flexithrix dorotheae]|uniref:DinB family protein n=1 Tax=Flexithrix dorotheae TaxID=70993 RepID=UPI000368EF19|nr:DinB family protein [Flexithrix dorotheae]